MELTPRTTPEPGGPRPARRRAPWAYAVLVLVAVGLAVVVWQGLTSASLYFYNADEALAQRADLGDRRFRLQGVVLDGSVHEIERGVEFTVVFNDAEVDVRHAGDPPELFQPGINVVLEGRWSDTEDVFESDTIKVKHSATYQAENEDRLQDAEDGRSGDPSTTTAP